MITGVDLFCGIGGLTHGLRRGGVRIVAGYDLDSDCRFAYEANNEAEFIEKDVNAITGDELRKHWPKKGYSLLAGCAPCQPFSTYSRKGRRTRTDLNWSLVKDFGRLVRESSPDFVTMENVPQLLDHPVFSEFVRSLGEYKIWKGIIECSRYGVPQTRKRLVLLASKHGDIQFSEPIPIDGKSDPTVRRAIAHLPPLKAGQADSKDSLHSACKLSPLNLKRIRASKPGGTWRDWKPSLLAKCHRKKSGETYPSIYGRMEWNGLAPTITTQCFGYGNGRFGHPEQDRAITLREAAILQTFPDSYKFLAKGERLSFAGIGRLIGNAVPVRLGEVVAKSLLNHVAEIKSR